MNAACCRGAARTIAGRRAARALGWVVPGTLLILTPKCPACFAAYVALASGVGLSLPVASFLRIAMIAVCAGSLAFLLIRAIHRRRARFSAV